MNAQFCSWSDQGVAQIEIAPPAASQAGTQAMSSTRICTVVEGAAVGKSTVEAALLPAPIRGFPRRGFCGQPATGQARAEGDGRTRPSVAVGRVRRETAQPVPADVPCHDQQDRRVESAAGSLSGSPRATILMLLRRAVQESLPSTQPAKERRAQPLRSGARISGEACAVGAVLRRPCQLELGARLLEGHPEGARRSRRRVRMRAASRSCLPR